MGEAALRWDMMRAREKGRIVYRHMAGRLRIVRGRLRVKEQHVSAPPPTQRHGHVPVRGAGQRRPPPLHDARLVGADENRLILSGYECLIEAFDRETHHGQTWVLVPCEGDGPVASRGPPFPG